MLERVHRFGGGIADLAIAIRRGDADAVVELLTDPPDDVRWIEADVADETALAHRCATARSHRRPTSFAAALAGDARAALEALGSFRILCAHRRGPYAACRAGRRVSRAGSRMRSRALRADERWYVGRPLLVTENDYELRLNNGDTGVIMRRDERVVAAFERGGEVVEYSPSRLSAIETVYAMTIHKSQGSQFDAAAVLLPEPGSRILTRELLYTAATRPRRQLILVATEESLRAAVNRPVARASGLRWRLWETR